jgi:SpoVK/Ycf46/Vps4 family AAA+-type ATPase
MKNHSELNALREALKFSSDNIPLLKLFAKASMEHWALEEGKEAFEKILSLQPSDIEAKLGLAQVLYQMGKISEASVRIEAILQENPNYSQAWLCSAKIKISEGEHRLANEFYHKALSLDKDLKDAALEKALFEAGLSGFSPQEPSSNSRMMMNTEMGWTPHEQNDPDQDQRTPLYDHMQNVEQPQITFAEVGGMENVKEEIRLKIIYPSQNPAIYKAYGKKSGGGVLLYGPPGCGKTLVSRATAGEIKASFISIGLHQILDMYIGNSEKNLHEIFELARTHTPSVLFIDEIDALAANRTDLRHSASRTLINQFLAEMDGDINSNEGVLILGATNAPWYIDAAFRRPGRFDRIIFIPTPDEEARIEILKVLANGRPVKDLDEKSVAKKTKDFSGADLKALFDLATEASLKKAMQEQRIIPITTSDLLKQTQNVIPSSKAWFESAKNYALYSNQSGLYDPILSFLGIKK